MITEAITEEEMASRKEAWHQKHMALPNKAVRFIYVSYANADGRGVFFYRNDEIARGIVVFPKNPDPRKLDEVFRALDDMLSDRKEFPVAVGTSGRCPIYYLFTPPDGYEIKSWHPEGNMDSSDWVIATKEGCETKVWDTEKGWVEFKPIS